MMHEVLVEPSMDVDQAVLCETRQHLYPSSINACPRCFREGGTMLTRIIGPHGGLLTGAKVTTLRIAKRSLAK